MKKCPFCNESIQADALKCRYCGEWLTKTEKVNNKPFYSRKINNKILLIVLVVIGVLVFDFFKNSSNPVGIVPDIKNTENVCNRKEPYKLEPEFDRALSLITQRELQSPESSIASINRWKNCLNIVYKNLPDAEGMFFFDNNSSTQDLTIFVSDTYKSSDDILTAILLRHELEHVSQFIKQIETGIKTPCFNAEAQAYYSELVFMVNYLNEEEGSSITQKVAQFQKGGYRGKSMESATAGLYGMLDKAATVYTQCMSIQDVDALRVCMKDKMMNSIDQELRSNPAYIQQCKE